MLRFCHKWPKSAHADRENHRFCVLYYHFNANFCRLARSTGTCGRQVRSCRITGVASQGVMAHDERTSGYDVAVLAVSGTNKDCGSASLSAATREAALRCDARLYVVFVDELDNPSTSAPDEATFELLEDLFGAISLEKPKVDLIPILALAGWTREKVAAELIPKVSVLMHVEGDSAGKSFCDGILRGKNAQEMPLSQRNVACGGTFDCMHAGHRLLLAATALASNERVLIGVTGDLLLAKKKYASHLQSYDDRARAAASYVKAVKPGVSVAVGALLDPKEPTPAATDQSMDALVVSEETVAGGLEINAQRKEFGFDPLRIVVVALVGIDPETGEKLSSTELRRRIAEKKGAAC